MITEYKQMIEGWVPKENFILRLVTGCAYQIVVFGALYGWMIYSFMKRKYTIKVKDN